MMQIAVLEEQKKNMVKEENEPAATESDQSEVKETNVTHEMQGKLNMNEMSEETKVKWQSPSFLLWMI